MKLKTASKLVIFFLIVYILLDIILVVSNNGDFLSFLKKDQETSVNEEIVIENKPIEIVNPEYDDFKAINDDYVARVVFESNMIDEPVVQAKGELSDYVIYAYNNKTIVKNYETGCEEGKCTLNAVYLRKDINNNFDIGGTVFMDYRNNLDDQNIIIYGHLYPKSMDPNKEMMFSPLEKLLEEENYEENKYVTLRMKYETRRYVVAYVYLFNANSDDYINLQYYRTHYNYDFNGNLDMGYFDKYVEYMESSSVYDTGVKLKENDRTLTLQTCYEKNSSLVQVVVCKEITE